MRIATPVSDTIKRCADVLGSLVGLVVLSPLLVGVGIAIRVRMGRPVLFPQARPGRFARPFVFYKFRTMEELDPGDKPRDETEQQRLTPLGAWLRRGSLDELPQLWNVLKGDMSLVGPRPLLMHYCARYTPEQARRHEVRPGVTGWAQIHGRNQVTWEERFELDVWYVDHRSLALDLKILMRTLWLVLRREGVSSEGRATMPEFRGSEEGQNSE